VEFVKIVLFSVGAAIVYGIVHDQVTAHLCVEYFTIAHPPLFPTQSPFWLAVGWGVIATWWVGLPLGILLGAVARAGPHTKLSLADVRPLIVRLLLVMAACAIVAGVLGAYVTATGIAQLPPYWAQVIPRDKQVAFATDSWAHLASYLSGVLGGLFVIGYALRRRMRLTAA
jgi:hypothetical protein